MPSPQGLIEAGRPQIRTAVLSAWDTFIELAEQADLSQSSRLPGWRGQEICVHLGSWGDHQAITGLIDSARTGGNGEPVDVDEANDAVTRAHRDAPREDVLAALKRNRDGVADYLEGDDALDRAETMATLGSLPLLTVISAQTYELAVHALDLVTCGAPQPPDAMLLSGVGALADVTGALAARLDITGGAVLSTPAGGWYFSADGGGWTTTPSNGRDAGRTPVVQAELRTLLDASSGRQNPVKLVTTRALKVRHMTGLLNLAPIVESAPGIPGGPILRMAARTLSGAGGLLGRFSSR